MREKSPSTRQDKLLSCKVAVWRNSLTCLLNFSKFILSLSSANIEPLLRMRGIRKGVAEIHYFRPAQSRLSN